MENKSKLLELRKKIKKRKPTFTSQNSHKSKEVNKSYRRAKGLHSKQRLSKKGYTRQVRKGYGSPTEIKGKNGEGLTIIVVNNAAEVQQLGEEHGIVISKRVGNKGRINITEAAKQKNIKILNIKDPEAFKARIEESIKQKKAEKEKKKTAEKEKETKKKEELAKKIEKKETETEKTEEEKKKEEKKEKDKILTKKGA